MSKKKKIFMNSKDIISLGKKTIFFIIIASILVPLLLDKFIFGNTYKSNITNGEWSSFLGSFLGGIIGGMGTLIAVLLTLMESRRSEYIRERPILILKSKLESGGDITYVGIGNKEDNNNFTGVTSFILENVGLGNAANIVIAVKFNKSKEKIEFSMKDVLSINKESKSIRIKDFERQHDNPRKINFEEPVEIYYEDLFGNKYLTKYKLLIDKSSYIVVDEIITIGEAIGA